MKINFSAPILDVKGQPVKLDEGNGKVSDATLGTLAVMALLANYQDEATLSGAEKLKRWNLASAITNADGALDVTIEQSALILRLIDKGFAPMLVGRAHELMDGASPI